MAKKNNKLDEQFGIMSNENINQCNELTEALSLINKEGVLTNMDSPIEAKQFIVKKNDNIKSISKMEFLERTEFELDEISDQAETAFTELMDIALNSSGKTCGEIANSAQSFLSIKLNAKLAKVDAKLKKMTQELNERKVQLQEMKMTGSDEDDGWSNPNDGIEIIPNT